MFGSKILCVILVFLIGVQMVESRRYFRGYRRHPKCSVRLGFIKITHKGCDFKIPSQGCHGQCLSSVQPFLTKAGFASSCSCCAPIKSFVRKVVKICHGKPTIIRVPKALRCACRPCWRISLMTIEYNNLTIGMKVFLLWNGRNDDVRSKMNS
jgi:hypothetical protein